MQVQLHALQCIASYCIGSASTYTSAIWSLCIGLASSVAMSMYVFVQRVKKNRVGEKHFYHVHHVVIAFCRSCTSDLTFETHRCDVFYRVFFMWTPIAPDSFFRLIIMLLIICIATWSNRFIAFNITINKEGAKKTSQCISNFH